jgi:putative restriction endonuclease
LPAVKSIFVAKIDSKYDDELAERYHFPKKYLKCAKETIGDGVVFYESRRDGGRLAYFATGVIAAIEPDMTQPDHYYARISNYLDFDRPVHFRENGGYESALVRSDGSVNAGTAQNSVRHIPEAEFSAILEASLDQQPDWPDRDQLISGFEEEQATFERPIIETILNRKYRDAKFRQQVQTAYDRRCAFTGLRLINGFGRPEVEAAHIKPVAANGPDSVRNGIAVSGTVHWMFDRGMISLRDDCSIMISRHLNSDVSHLINNDMMAVVPTDVRLRPAPLYLEYHRDCVFKS